MQKTLGMFKLSGYVRRGIMGYNTKCGKCGTEMKNMNDDCPVCFPPKEKENSS